MASTDKIHFNADEAERPQEFEPFVTVLNGRTITISDPADIDFQDLLEIENPMGFFKYTMSQEDRDWLASERGIKGWRLGLVLEQYLKHFQAADRIEQRKKLGF